jgi:chromate transporter
LRNDFVLHRHVLTDRELNTSLAITRTTPGPMGLYVVSVGYFVDGTPGAVAGWLAMITPALLMIPLLEFVRRKVEHPRFKAVLRCVVFASAGLLWVTVPLARDAIYGYLTLGIALAAFVFGITKKVDSLWIVLSAAVITMLAGS